MTYNVYKPAYHVVERTQKGELIYGVTLKKLGTARSMVEAKAKFGGYPILEEQKI